MRSGYWQDCTTRDFAQVDPESTVALLPVAAIEQHGPHLPLATDALINDGIVRRTLDLAAAPPNLLVLPALTVGHSLEHTAYPGTLTLSLETLLGVWTDVGRSAARAGIRKLVIFNTHGGQGTLVTLAALRLRVELGLFVARANYYAFGAPNGLFDEHELKFGLHGGETETSLMLHLHPGMVRTAALQNFSGLPERMAAENEMLGAEKRAGFGWMSQDLHPDGVCGNALRADAEKGRLYLDYLAESLARLVAEVAATPLAVLRDRG